MIPGKDRLENVPPLKVAGTPQVQFTEVGEVDVGVVVGLFPTVVEQATLDELLLTVVVPVFTVGLVR